MTEQRPKTFTSQQARKAFFVGRARQNAAHRNTNPYMQQPWQQSPPHSTSQGSPSSQPTPPPAMQFQQSYMSQEQAFDQFHRFHRYQSEQLRYQSEQLRYHQDWSRQLFQNLFMMPAAVPANNQPVNQVPCQFPQPQHGFPVASYFPRHPPWTEPPNPPGPNTPQPYPMSQPHGQEPPILKNQHVYSPNGILNPDVIRCEEVDDDTASEPSTTKTRVEASTACPPSSSTSPFSKAQDGSQEPKLKRKSSTENADTLKKAKLEPTQSIDSETKPTLPKQPEPKAVGKGSTQSVRELNQSCENAKYESPIVDDESNSKRPANAAAVSHKSTNATIGLSPPLPPSLTPLSNTHGRSDTAISSSPSFKSRSGSLDSSTNQHVSSSSSIDDDATLRHSVQVTPHSRKAANMISLNRSLRLAKHKLNSPGWENGVPLGDFITFTKEHLNDLSPPEWYSTQTVLAWRSSLEIPSNWIVVVPGEDPKRHPISEGTTDIIRVNHENERLHWTLTHLSIENWTVTYHDSYLGKDGPENDASYMTQQCNELVHDVRRKHPKRGITMPSKDPPKSAQCTIRQYDSFSCGPFTLRQAEKLLGFEVDDDQGCPLAIRGRHIQSIFKAISKRIDEPRPLSSLEQMHNTSDLEEIAAPKFLPKAVTATDWVEKPATSISQATTTCSSPDLEHSIASPNAVSPIEFMRNNPYLSNYILHTRPSPELEYSTTSQNAANHMRNDDRYLPNSLLHEGLDDSHFLKNLDRTTPPPVFKEHFDDCQDILVIAFNPLNKRSTKDRGTEQATIVEEEGSAEHGNPKSAMLRELVSSLKVAQEMPRPRPRPSYRTLLPNIGGGDVSMFKQNSAEDSDFFACLDYDAEDSSSLDGLIDHSDNE